MKKEEILPPVKTTEEKKNRIKEIEWQMNQPDFWNNKIEAHALIKEIEGLKDELEGIGKYDKGSAIITILSGAGGDDAEDFSRILYGMYLKFAQNKNWETFLIHSNENDHGGYRNITFEVLGKSAYGKLKNESGVHRLVRISPFNAQKKRHTSFSMVEVIPKLEKLGDIEIPEDDLKIEFAKSSGPGGQNVNKRETAVRIVHLPTNISVQVESERSQQQNREKAMEMIEAKLIKRQEEDRLAKEKGMQISKTVENEWGSQIRSYVFHPYQMIKDHRTGVEVRNIDKILEDGELDIFVEGQQK
ncbi:PCRF domain-containing protein [Candidatus Parcubacteria bacterium]|nr:PCRF domain-containing protein [Candidatus Parcubacteria bacterium]